MSRDGMFTSGPVVNLGQNVAPDISALAEQLCRIEHKLDLLLEGLATQIPELPLRPMTDEANACPVCQVKPVHTIDVFKGHVVRTCGCGSGVFPGPFNQFQIGPNQQGTGNAE